MSNNSGEASSEANKGSTGHGAYVSYRRVSSANYQSTGHEFGMWVENAPDHIRAGNVICKAIVNKVVDGKAGYKRNVLDKACNTIYGISWNEFSNGTADAEEEV